MKTIFTLLLTGAMTLPLLAQAQETTAAGSMNQEASWSALKAMIEKADGKAETALILSKAMAKCNDKQMLYMPSATSGKDADSCVSAGGEVPVGTYTTSINGAKGYPPNSDLTAAKTLFVAASSYGGGGESCPVSIAVNGTLVALDYAIRYQSSVSAIIPAGATWRVNASGGNCSGRQVNVSVLPLAK